MTTLIPTLCCIFTVTGWVWESLRHLKQMEKAADLSQEMVAENIKLRRELNSEKFRSSVRIADLEEKIKDLENENSQQSQELTEAKTKLKTAHNNLRILMVEFNRAKQET